MSLADLLPLLAVLTVGLLTPGPDFVLVLKNGLRSAREGQATALGITAGLACQTAVLGMGFAMIGSDPRVLTAVRYAGSAVLLWLGLKLLLAKRQQDTRSNDGLDASPAHPRTAFTEGFLCNVTNPKAIVFFASLFARFQTEGGTWRTALLLTLTVVLHGFICWSLLAKSLQFPPVRTRLERWQFPLLRAFGVMLLLLGASAAVGK